MNEQYYCLHLDDYSTPAFISYGKAYYGTMEDLKAFIDALDKAEETHERFEKLIGAFRDYEAGNTAVTHNVAFQEIPLLEPVKLLGTAIQTWKAICWLTADTVQRSSQRICLNGMWKVICISVMASCRQRA